MQLGYDGMLFSEPDLNYGLCMVRYRCENFSLSSTGLKFSMVIKCQPLCSPLAYVRFIKEGVTECGY